MCLHTERSPEPIRGNHNEKFAIVFLIQGQKYYGVSIDSAAMLCDNLCYNCYEHNSEFAGSGQCPPPLI